MSARALAFGLLLSWCFAMLVFRVFWSGTVSYVFLIWNLFLALIPAAAAEMLARAAAERRASQWMWGAAWLLFLPNAPYIATDFLHLRARPHVPLWYDVALLASCAITGLLLGYVSLLDVQRVVRERAGAAVAWLCACAALLLSAFGIYLGRFQRWNSWDILTEPWMLLADIADRVLNPLSHPRTVGVTAVYGGALVVGYLALRLILAAELRQKRYPNDAYGSR